MVLRQHVLDPISIIESEGPESLFQILHLGIWEKASLFRRARPRGRDRVEHFIERTHWIARI
uniref:Uncharacterized protein n=1 Tax=Utricularia reniformis TaxID=192314 RepID=A0A1Y0AZU6_9LAMI|nr:hypothetical protein AEK19_MT0389 [Utricularia reniformis]ART30659.1 hypothetical protein AEK19_MT0389 [Utricularia reniformis]